MEDTPSHLQAEIEKPKFRSPSPIQAQACDRQCKIL